MEPPPNGRVFGLYVGGRSPVKVEKRARRRCLFKTRLFAKLQLVRQRCGPFRPGFSSVDFTVIVRNGLEGWRSRCGMPRQRLIYK